MSKETDFSDVCVCVDRCVFLPAWPPLPSRMGCLHVYFHPGNILKRIHIYRCFNTPPPFVIKIILKGYSSVSSSVQGKWQNPKELTLSSGGQEGTAGGAEWWHTICQQSCTVGSDDLASSEEREKWPRPEQEAAVRAQQHAGCWWRPKLRQNTGDAVPVCQGQGWPPLGTPDELGPVKTIFLYQGYNMYKRTSKSSWK